MYVCACACVCEPFARTHTRTHTFSHFTNATSSCRARSKFRRRRRRCFYQRSNQLRFETKPAPVCVSGAELWTPCAVREFGPRSLGIVTPRPNPRVCVGGLLDTKPTSSSRVQCVKFSDISCVCALNCSYYRKRFVWLRSFRTSFQFWGRQLGPPIRNRFSQFKSFRRRFVFARLSFRRSPNCQRPERRRERDNENRIGFGFGWPTVAN